MQHQWIDRQPEWEFMRGHIGKLPSLRLLQAKRQIDRYLALAEDALDASLAAPLTKVLFATTVGEEKVRATELVRAYCINKGARHPALWVDPMMDSTWSPLARYRLSDRVSFLNTLIGLLVGELLKRTKPQAKKPRTNASRKYRLTNMPMEAEVYYLKRDTAMLDAVTKFSSWIADEPQSQDGLVLLWHWSRLITGYWTTACDRQVPEAPKYWDNLLVLKTLLNEHIAAGFTLPEELKTK